MTELKSCPFCGGEAAHFALNEAVFKATWVSHVTHCTKCQARVQSLNSEASIILWNTRANPPTPDYSVVKDALIMAHRIFMETGVNRESDERWDDMAKAVVELYVSPNPPTGVKK